MPDLIEVARLPVGRQKKLTRNEWEKVERFLEQWKRETAAAVKQHPARSYELGRAQAEALAKLMEGVGRAHVPPTTAGIAPSAREARYWTERYTFHEIDDSLNRYVGRIKDELLYGLREAWNPVSVASALYKATRDQEVNWRTIARTEMVRANSAGRLNAAEKMGYGEVWVMPHAGACKHCRRILELKHFPIEQVRDATNRGRGNPANWIACIPLHPHCRHSWLPYEPDVYQEYVEEFAKLKAAGLTADSRLDRMFETSGQIKPQYADQVKAALKTEGATFQLEGRDFYLPLLADSIEKARGRRRPQGMFGLVAVDELRTDLYQRQVDPLKVEQIAASGKDLKPPAVSKRRDGTIYVLDGQHQVEAAKLRGKPKLVCRVYTGLSWEEEWQLAAGHDADSGSVTETGDGSKIEKGYFDPEQAGLDPLLWQEERLRKPVTDRLRGWAERTLGRDYPSFARLYLTGGATSLQWESHPEQDPDVDLQIVVDWPALRRARRAWAKLTDPELHLAVVTLVRAGLGDEQVVPGLDLDAFVRPEQGPTDFDQDAKDSGQAVWDVTDERWLYPPVAHRQFERYGEPWLEGPAAEIAADHPEWEADAERAQLLLGKLLADDETGDGHARERLKAAYTALHDGRRASFAPGGGGNLGRGNFIWQHVWNYGSLPQVKAIVTAKTLNELWPGMVAKTAPPVFPKAGVKVFHNGQGIGPYGDWGQVADRLVHHFERGHTGVHAKVPQTGGYRSLYAHEQQHVIGLAHDRIAKTDENIPAEYSSVAKMGRVAPNTGVEHWITVHPNGEDQPGQPVLVRNNSDGSMSVIGGAGGSLNYLRLDPKRRVKSKREQNDQGDGHAMTAEQPISEEEQKRQEAEFDEARKEHQARLEQITGRQRDLEHQLRQYVGSDLIKGDTGGVDDEGNLYRIREHPDGTQERVALNSKEQRRLIKQLRASAVHTLAYGELEGKDAADAGISLKQNVGDYEDMPEEGKPEEPGEPPDSSTPPPPDEEAEQDPLGQMEQVKERRARLAPLSSDQAESFMRLQTELARLRREAGKSRKVLRGEGKHSEASGLEWSDSDIDKDVAKQVGEEKRTDFARQLLETTERNTYKKANERAFHQGAFDTVDAFTSAVLGRTGLTAEAARLLGPAGAAQLAVHAIRDEASKSGLDMQKVYDALGELTQRQEEQVASRGLARARSAADTAVLAREERKLSEAGESLGTTTMWRSFEQQKMNEAARQLGMAIGGFEAASSLKVALANPGQQIKVGGFESPGQIKALAQKAKIKVNASDITRVEAGNYSLSVEPERVRHLFDPERTPDWEHRQLLKKIRTGKGMAREIERNRDTPGMSDELSPAQAQGKMFLLSTGKPGTARHWNLTGTPIEKSVEDLRAMKALGQTLAFAPGVGKTHTGIAAAMQLMHDEPDKHHRVLVVSPTTALSTWANTIAKQGPGHSVQVVGAKYRYDDELGNKTPLGSRLSGKQKGAQYDNPADFNVISFETLAKEPDLAKKLGATVVITDEAQKAKNAQAGNWRGLKEVGDAAGVERPAVESKTNFKERYGKLGQEEHVTREDKIRQFREGLDDNLFQLSAAAAGNSLPERQAPAKGDATYDASRPGTFVHKVALDPDHTENIKKVAASINEWRDAYKRGEVSQGPAFGGRRELQAALYDRPHNAMARQVGDLVDQMGPVDFPGFKGHPDHEDGEAAGTYAPKAIVFSQFVKQLDHVVGELEGRGHKVFYAHGGLGNDKNDEVLKQYLAYKGKAVLVTSDKNSTARSLQFGDNSGKFQHGATQLIHYSLPDNNATIEQREARIHRRGAQVPVQVHSINADTPAEMRQADRLTSEKRTQELAGTSEQLVGGKETLRHLLEKRGVKPEELAAAQAESEPTPNGR